MLTTIKSRKIYTKIITSLNLSMRTIAALTIVTFVTYASAWPAIPNVYIDIYKNTLIPQPRVVGGEDAERHQFPYQVSIRWSLVGVKSHLCGASLIEPGWALTAGHCKAYSVGSYDVVLGLLKQGENINDTQKIDVADFIVHPNFTGGVATSDVALIRLASEAVITEAVQLIELGSEAECSALDQVAVLSGWGLTGGIIPITPSILQYIDLPRISNQDCAEALTSLLGSSDPLDDTMICTGQDEGEKQSACSGDSGGPLASLGKLIGIVSWGIIPCGRPGAPSVYTKVSSHADWINQTISNNSS